MEPARNRTGLLIVVFLIFSMAHAQTVDNINKKTKSMEATMTTTQKNKAIVRRLYEEALNKRNMQLLQDFVSDDFVGVSGTKGAAGFEEPVAALVKAFPDVQWNVQEIVAEGDKVIIRWKLQGTHKGQFQIYAPTDKVVSNDGIGIFELKEGKIINARVYTDRLGFLQQLEVLPRDLSLLLNGKTHDGHVRFIDKFFVPKKGIPEFMERVNVNRNFIRTLPGFIEDAAYERKDENGNLIFITVAVWESEEVVKKAKEAVQSEYKREGFDMAGMLKRLGITMDRGMYTAVIR